MENCLDGAEIEYQERTTLKDLTPSEIKYFSSPEKLDSSSGMIMKHIHSAAGLYLNETNVDVEMENVEDSFFNETEF
jgi:hypothetical protein